MRLRCVLAAAMLVLPGCAARVPEGIKQYAPTVGYTLISGRRVLGGNYVASSIHIPGNRATSRPPKFMECAGPGPRIEFFAYEAATGAGIPELCGVVREVAESTRALFPSVRLRYRIYVALPGQRFDFTSASWSRERPRLSIGIPAFADRDRMRANLADLLAHEAFHLAGYMVGKQSVSGDEFVAYRVGVCAAMASVGYLDESWLPGAALAGSGDAVVEASSGAARRVREELERFVEDGRISADTAKGQAFLASCGSLRADLSARLTAD